MTVITRATGGRSGSGSISAMRRPPRVTTRRSSASISPASVEQRRRLGAELVEVDVEPDARARAAEPGEVIVDRERAAAVQADHLEAAVAAQQALVGDRDAGVGRVGDDAVERGELRRHAISASGAARPPFPLTIGSSTGATIRRGCGGAGRGIRFSRFSHMPTIPSRQAM